MLEQVFKSLVGNYSKDQDLPDRLWLEIEKRYSSSKRHYHNLDHLEQLLNQLNEVKDQVRDLDVMLFSMFYHDIVYRVPGKNNEEKSAAFAADRMQQLSIPPEQIDKCVGQILATKAHEVSEDEDTNLFTDADLSILGQDWQTYSAYFKNVRKEYAFYPDFIYNQGRKKVLDHLLSLERIFKTDYFYHRYESQARQNMTNEKELYDK